MDSEKRWTHPGGGKRRTVKNDGQTGVVFLSQSLSIVFSLPQMTNPFVNWGITAWGIGRQYYAFL